MNVTTAELEQPPAVGKKLAQKIILAREQQKFTSLKDLDRVLGISQKTLEKWENMVTW
ncbi:DUF655 domain-containing protein [Anabaena sp. FACHB-1237]|uniref:ComEA family DNA-binding protein n=1 Tax=Anabaena sp. FACHB-1237 TaxID=2692769 RepID=UPI0016816A9E|nr:DUF655 domain-containing protein [Anabaena sp. FACHB-1237]MBD2138811.1 DUF655 domain-containing protein [Anabaena sp. FACHB-1237]